MIVTEATAHLYACPSARVSYIDNASDIGIELAGGANRIVRTAPGVEPTIHFVPVGCGCIGPMCMAWQKLPMPEGELPSGFCKAVMTPLELLPREQGSTVF